MLLKPSKLLALAKSLPLAQLQPPANNPGPTALQRPEPNAAKLRLPADKASEKLGAAPQPPTVVSLPKPKGGMKL
jgi:hypothetical protein